MKMKPTLLALALASAFVQPASAIDRYWVCGSNWWDNLCWASAPGGSAVRLQPHDGDNAWLVQSDSIDRVVDYRNTALPLAMLGNLVIDATGAGSITLNQNRDALNTQFTYIGTSGAGHVVQTGGSHYAHTKLSLGYLANGNGSYSLGDTGTFTSPDEFIGDVGVGSFVQSGGGHFYERSTLGQNAGTGLNRSRGRRSGDFGGVLLRP